MKILSKQFIGILLFIACLAASNTLKAQLANPYEFGNTSTCSIKVRYQFYYMTLSGCVACPGGGGSLIVPPGLAINFPLPCSPACNVMVTVEEIDGVQLSNSEKITVDIMATSGNNTCSSCNCTSYNMNWTNGNAKFF
jgi:hypothetical protein